MKILFTICGRAGSKGFKNKNLKKMNGVPLVFYTLASIRAFQQENPGHQITVAVNTDSPELVSCIQSQQVCQDIRFVERKAELAGDTAPKVAVIQDTYLTLAKDQDFDVVIDLDITSPYRRAIDIANVVAEFQKDPAYDLVFSVVPARRSPYFNMVERKESGYFHKICDAQFTARQQAPKSYEMNASIYAYHPRFLRSEIQKTILDYNCGIIEMPDYLVLDIDSEEDFEMMQFLHSHYCGLDPMLNQVYTIAGSFLNDADRKG